MEPAQIVKAIDEQLDRIVAEADVPLTQLRQHYRIYSEGIAKIAMLDGYGPASRQSRHRQDGLTFERWVANVLSGNYAKR